MLAVKLPLKWQYSQATFSEEFKQHDFKILILHLDQRTYKVPFNPQFL